MYQNQVQAVFAALQIVSFRFTYSLPRDVRIARPTQLRGVCPSFHRVPETSVLIFELLLQL